MHCLAKEGLKAFGAIYTQRIFWTTLLELAVFHSMP